MSSKKTFEKVQKQQFIDRKCFYKQSIDKEELKKNRLKQAIILEIVLQRWQIVE